MAKISISDKEINDKNIYYIQSGTAEILSSTGSRFDLKKMGSRIVLSIDCPDNYFDILKAELSDKTAEVIAVKYKYDFYKKRLPLEGLNKIEKEILIASLIAADLEDDKRYAFDRIKEEDAEIAVDGTFNFRLKPLKRKWEEVVSYIPSGFLTNQMYEFISYLLENKKKRVYVENGRVYDAHFRRLKRTDLLDLQSESVLLEVLLSNCGVIELCGKIPEIDEKYLKEFYGDKIIFSTGNFS